MEIIPIDPNPKTYNTDWLLFDDTVFTTIQGPACSNTIEGVCYNTESLEHCIDKCEKNNNCSHGYYLSSPDNNICVPVYTPDFINKTNFSYELINIKNFPSIDYKATAFLNTEMNSFPPKNTMNVFYDDVVKMEVNDKVLSLEEDSKNVIVSDDESKHIKFRISQIIINTDFAQLPLNYNSKYLLLIDKNNLTIGIDNLAEDLAGQNITTEPAQNTVRGALEQMYEIIPVDIKKIGNPVNYFEQFYLKMNTNKTTYYYTIGSANKYIMTKEDGLLYLTDNIEEANLFKFTPVETAYKCENNNCVTTQLLKDSENIYRDKTCFNQCNKINSKEFYSINNKSKNNNQVLLLCIILIVLILIIILFFCI